MTESTAANNLEFSLQGHFLMSMPQLNGSYFGQSLILMCEHNADGALGLIVNKPTSIDVRKMLEELDIECTPVVNDRKVFEGGPVAQDRGFVVHNRQLENADCLKLADSIYLSGATAALTELLEAPERYEFLVLLGYAGWGAGQLEQETQRQQLAYCRSHKPSCVRNSGRASVERRRSRTGHRLPAAR